MYGSQSLSDGYSMCDWCGVPSVIVSRCLAEGRVSGDESTVHFVEHELGPMRIVLRLFINVFHSSQAILL